MVPLSAKQIQVAADVAVAVYKIVLAAALVYQIVNSGQPNARLSLNRR